MDKQSSRDKRVVLGFLSVLAVVTLGTMASSPEPPLAPKPTKTPTPTATASPTATDTPTPTDTVTPTASATATAVQYMHFTSITYPSCPFGWAFHPVNERSCQDWAGGIVCNFHMANTSTDGWRCTRMQVNFTDSRPGTQPYFYVSDSNTTGYYINSFPKWQMGPQIVYYAALGSGPLPGEGVAHKSGSFSTSTRGFDVQNATQWSSEWVLTLYIGPAMIPPTPMPATATPTATETPAATPTNTHTATSIPPPNNNGSGSCWASGASWPTSNAGYLIDDSVSLAWVDSINEAAAAWTQVTPSTFALSAVPGSPNEIDYGPVDKPKDWIAITYVYGSRTTLTRVTTTFDETNLFDPSVIPSPEMHSVKNVMVHEFGHWLMLRDIRTSGCEAVSMWYNPEPGEVSNLPLDGHDEEGANWQYP